MPLSRPGGRRGAPADRDVAAVVGGALVTGMSSTFVRLSGASPATAAFFRCVYALPVLVVLALRERGRHRLRPAETLRALGSGVFLGVDLMLWYRSIPFLGAGLSTVVTDTQVVFVAAAAWFLFGERVSRRTLLLLPLLIGGIALIAGVAGTPPAGGDPVRGTALALASAAAYAGFILLLRRPDATPGTHAGFLLVSTVATGATAAVAGLADGGLDLVPGWPGHGWLLLVALTTQVAGWMVISVAMDRVGAAHASVALLLQPVAAVLSARVLLGEVPTGTQLAGVGIVVVCVALATAVEARVVPAVGVPAVGGPAPGMPAPVVPGPGTATPGVQPSPRQDRRVTACSKPPASPAAGCLFALAADSVRPADGPVVARPVVTGEQVG